MKFQIDIPGCPSSGVYRVLLALLYFLCSFSSVASAQSRAELERQRKQLIQEIQKTSRELSQTKKDKKTAFRAFSAIRNQVQNRQLLINNLQSELDIYEKQIASISSRLHKIESDLSRLQQEYGELLKNAYHIKLNQNWLLFLFSAKSINDSFKRWRYIRQSEAYRKRHMKLLLETSSDLAVKKQELERTKIEKKLLLETVEEQNQLMYSEMDRKSNLLTNLSNSERNLIRELNKQQKDKDKLNRAIAAIIEEAITTTEPTPAISGRTSPKSDKGHKLYGESKIFFEHKGRLPWPVIDPVVTKQFGKQVHATVRTIQITNNGIDLRPKKDLQVNTVFNGTVVGIQFIPGFNNTVIVKHGIFYTVYSNLEEVFVERGDKMKNGQPIGRLNKKNPELHFEIWQEKTRLNPITWLGRRS